MNDQSEKKDATFEEAMLQLEQIVEQLETGEVPLEEAIKLFQEGMQLSKKCHDKLERVEKQVNILIEEEGELVKKRFNIEEDPV